MHWNAVTYDKNMSYFFERSRFAKTDNFWKVMMTLMEWWDDVSFQELNIAKSNEAARIKCLIAPTSLLSSTIVASDTDTL